MLDSLQVRIHRLTPNEVEAWFLMETDAAAPEVEMSGKLVGPKCVRASTIEVAYPLVRFPQSGAGRSSLSRRVVVPEPSLWDLERPFLYTATLRLNRGTDIVEERRISLGFRHIVQTPEGLHCNGKSVSLQVEDVANASPVDAERLRSKGVTAMVIRPDELDALELGDRLGMFGLVCIGAASLDAKTRDALETHPALLGYVVTPYTKNELRSELAKNAVSGQRNVLFERP